MNCHHGLATIAVLLTVVGTSCMGSGRGEAGARTSEPAAQAETVLGKAVAVDGVALLRLD